MIVLRYEDGDIRVMLVSNCGLVRILLLKFVIPVACTYGNRCVTNLKHEVFFECHPFCGGRDRAMVNSYQPFP